MRLLPFKRLRLFTESTPDVVEAKLADIVRTQWFSQTPPPEPFRGSVRGRHFKVLRVLEAVGGLKRGNSFQPVIVGDVVPVPGGTEVRARMRLAWFATTFMAIWFGGLLWAAQAVLRMGLAGRFWPAFFAYKGTTAIGPGAGLVFIGAMLAAGYAFVSVSFWTEVKKAKVALCEGLGCREVGTANRLVHQ